MVSPSRSSTSRRRRVDTGKLFSGGLILSGLVASVFLVFSDNVQFVRVGLVAALWAAAIGALAATRYRKAATIDKAKVRDLQTVYELQLEREVTARREYELGVEARVRAEVGADATELAALRAELTVLRQSLQRLFDGNMPMDRPALRADATRIQELTSSSVESANNSSVNAGMWSAFADQQPRSSTTPIFEPDHPRPPVFASPFDEPVTAETAAVSSDEDDQDDEHGPRGWAEAFTETAGKPVDEPPKQPVGRPEPSPGPVPPATPAPIVGTPSARRRRRVEEDGETPSGRLSVAEIMANLQSEERDGR
ncbi:DUF6779 domain-containing protein [Nocardia sp. R6R-6]|uniref:DUF6779 domain-containing protein n=1 Tax=Nocardia sp. R6R-6 TaxID=3459303 RepID=UPI00403E031B